MMDTRRACWFKTSKKETEWTPGTFHVWSQDHQEYESGPGPIPVAIVEDNSGVVRVVYAELVMFRSPPR